MSEEERKKPEWPPLPEDLRRLYLDEHLSAAKIAAYYGLEYASPKTAESTVLHHLKKNGITRRDKVEHIRKVTGKMVDGWVKRYEDGESLKQIAGVEVNPVTVFNHLRKRGLQLRDKVEAQIEAVTIHEKKPFDGDTNLRAYMIGIGRGDYAVTGHGRAVRVRLSTTHPAMSRLFKDLFEAHGPIYEYPKRNDLTGFEWCLDCDLDSSFGFMADSSQPTAEIFDNEALFIHFLAGFFDAEGSVWYHKKGKGGAFEVSISNVKEELLRKISAALKRMGFSPIVSFARQRKSPQIRGELAEFIWLVQLWKHDDVARFLRSIPLRHSEKVRKSSIALKLGSKPPIEQRAEVLKEWDSWKGQIENEVDEYIRNAGESKARRQADTTNI